MLNSSPFNCFFYDFLAVALKDNVAGLAASSIKALMASEVRRLSVGSTVGDFLKNHIQ